MIKDIASLRSRNWQVQIVHVLREGNRCADLLARMGSSQLEQFMPWESPSRLLVSPSRDSWSKRLAAAPAKAVAAYTS